MRSDGAVVLDQTPATTFKQVADEASSDRSYQDAMKRARDERLRDKELRRALRRNARVSHAARSA